MKRSSWLALPVTPALRHARAAAGLDESNLIGWSRQGLSFGVSPRLELSSYDHDDGRSLSESGNGLDLEASWTERAAFWLHFKDSGLSGDLDLLDDGTFNKDGKWNWTEVQDSGELTHDEQRAGAALEIPVGETGHVTLALLRDHLRWGSGLLRTTQIQGDQSPSWPMFLMSFTQGPLNYQQSIGELHSEEWLSGLYPDEAGGHVRRELREKWLLSHRLEWLAKWGSIAAGEALIMGDRRPGPGNMIPTALIWSEQHASGDRDNSMLFLDGRLRLPRHVPGSWMLYAELSVDDYSLGDFAEELEGQRTSTLLGLSGCPLPVEDLDAMRLGRIRIPGISWLSIEQSRQRPYVGGHFYSINRFDHAGVSLGAFDHPNSRSIDWEWRHELTLPVIQKGRLGLHSLLEWTLAGSHLVHGANPTDGSNVGGDRYLPHRATDPQEASFLAGDLETSDLRNAGLKLDVAVAWREKQLGRFKLDLAWIMLHQHDRLESNLSKLSSFSLAWVQPF